MSDINTLLNETLCGEIAPLKFTGTEIHYYGNVKIERDEFSIKLLEGNRVKEEDVDIPLFCKTIQYLYKELMVKQILIPHITNLLTLTLNGKIKPIDFGERRIDYDGITIECEPRYTYNRISSEYYIIEFNDKRHKIEEDIDTLNLKVLFRETMYMLNSNRVLFEKEKLNMELKEIIEKLQR